MPASAGSVEPGTEVKLDVYAPTRTGRWPVVIWAPGGLETKAAGTAFGRLMASKGAVVFVIDTARSPDLMPEPLGIASRTFVEQASCAVRAARALAPQYSGDPGRIVWAGWSAGGMFGAELAFADADFERLWAAFVAASGGPSATVECLAEGGPDTVDALVIASSGRYADIIPSAYDSDPVLRDFTASVSHLGNNLDLKVRLVHGTDDPDVPFSLAEAMDAALRSAGYDAKLTVVDGGGHAQYNAELAELVLEALGP